MEIKKTKDLIQFDEGYTYYFFLSSIFLMISGGILMLFFWSLAIFIILIGILLLLIKSGTSIDIKNKSISRYKYFFGFYMHNWINIEKAETINIDYVRDTSWILRHKSITNTSRSKTYTMYIIWSNHKKMFHEFTNHKNAISVGKILASKFNLKLVDKVSNLQRSAMKRNRR